METEILYGISNEEYHRGEFKDYISSSDIRKFMESPAKFRYGEREETAAMRFGSLYHEYILEGKLDYRVYATDKAQKKAEEAVKRMGEVFRNNKTARALISQGESEVTILWEDEDTLKCKCRPDHLTPNNMIIDLKTTANRADIDSFRRTMNKWGYDIQDAWYRRGVAKALGLDILPSFVFIVQEKTPPYLMGFYEIGGDKIFRAMAKIDDALAEMKECFETDEWGGYSNEIVTIYDN